MFKFVCGVCQVSCKCYFQLSEQLVIGPTDSIPPTLCVFPCISTHVLTEDVVFREVTADQRLLSRRLLTKTNRMPRWAEFLFPSNLSRSVYIVEDSVVDPVTKSLTTYTWNLNHTTLMVRYAPTYAPFRIDP